MCPQNSPAGLKHLLSAAWAAVGSFPAVLPSGDALGEAGAAQGQGIPAAAEPPFVPAPAC